MSRIYNQLLPVVTHCWSVIWQTLRMRTIRSQRTGCKISTKQSFKWVILSKGTSTVCYKIHKRSLPSEWSWAMGHQHFVIKSTKETFQVSDPEQWDMDIHRVLNISFTTAFRLKLRFILASEKHVGRVSGCIRNFHMMMIVSAEIL
jgi:hypothetical protein